MSLGRTTPSLRCPDVRACRRTLATLTTDAIDPHARGLAAGSALAQRTALCLAAYLPLFADLGHPLDDVRRFGERVLERVREWHSPLAAELEAFALGAGIEPELIAALNGRTELLAFAECTTVGRCESAEGPWLAQNWDWYADAPERCVVWSAAVEGARFATMTEAGILAKVGVSTRGIAVALNILYHAERRDGRARRARAPRPAPPAGRGREPGDAWELLRETPYSASSCITVVDAGGDGACFELSPAGVARVEPRDGLLAHTNHFLDETLAPERGRAARRVAARVARASGHRPACGAGRAGRGPRRARRSHRSEADLPPRRAAGRARQAARGHGRLAGDAAGRAGAARGRRPACECDFVPYPV